MTMRLATITLPILFAMLAGPGPAMAQGTKPPKQSGEQSGTQGGKGQGQPGQGQSGQGQSGQGGAGEGQGKGDPGAGNRAMEEHKMILGPQVGEGDDPERGITDGIDIATVYESSFNVQLMQDPVRIGPGESGTLLIYVIPNTGTSIDAGGQVLMSRKQGALNFGSPAFDQPKKGKARHDDAYFIRVPVTVAPGTKYGEYKVDASLRLRGHFNPSQHFDNPEINKRIVDANKNGGNRTVSGLITVGRPIPRPTRRPGKKSVSKPSAANAGGDAGPVFVDAALGLRARGVFAPSKVVPGASTALRVELEVPEKLARFSVKSLRVDGELDGLEVGRFDASKSANERSQVEMALSVDRAAQLGPRRLEAILEARIAEKGAELRTEIMRLPLALEVVKTEAATVESPKKAASEGPELGLDDDEGGGPPFVWIVAGAGFVLIVLLVLARRGS